MSVGRYGREPVATMIFLAESRRRAPPGHTGRGVIARRWHGRVPAEKAQAYLALMRGVAIPDYRATPGNLGAWCLSRAEGGIVHVEMFSLWESREAIARFAGEEIGRARYYDFDPDYLLELEPHVMHFDAAGEGSRIR